MVALQTIKKSTILLITTVVSVSVALFFIQAHQLFALGSTSLGYTTNDQELLVGMAVSLNSDADDKQVEAATTTNAEKFVGIITTKDDNLINVSDVSSELLVTTSGEVSAYVSNLNGEIKRGDFVSVSSLKGVLMKSDQSTDLGSVAVALQDSESMDSVEHQIQTNSGDKTIAVGKINVEINQNIIENKQDGKSALVIAGQALTGKEVSQTQVILASFIFIVLLIVEGSIIYGAIHSSIGALGRNPLAQKAVFKQLLQVSWLGIVVFVIGFGSIYLILWL